MNKMVKTIGQYELSNIDETLVKMGKTLDFMKQLKSEIKTNQTTILHVNNIDDKTLNFAKNEIEQRIRAYPNAIQEMQEQLDYLKSELIELQNKSSDSEDKKIVPNRFLEHNGLIEKIFSTPKYYDKLDINDLFLHVKGIQKVQIKNSFTSLRIETPVTPITSFTKFDKKVFLALMYSFQKYIEDKSKIVYRSFAGNATHPSETCSSSISITTNTIINLLGLDIDEDIHNKIAKSINKIRNTTIQIIDKNGIQDKVNLIIITGSIGVGEQDSNEPIDIRMEREVFDIIMRDGILND